MDGRRRNRAALCNRPDETHRPDRLGAASTPQCMSAIGLYTYGGYGIDRYVRYSVVVSACRSIKFSRVERLSLCRTDLSRLRTAEVELGQSKDQLVWNQESPKPDTVTKFPSKCNASLQSCI